MRVPRRWLLVALLSLSLSLPRPGRAGRCQPGELRQLWGGHTKCCPPCPWKGEDPWPCEAIQDHECRCPPGSGCGDESCLSCRRLPRCEPGWEPHRIGIIDFHFECRRCGNGSYSGRNGWCRNWTDCESSGFITLRAGNSTHNAVCGLPGRAPQPGGPPVPWGWSGVLAALTAAAVLLLLLLTALLLLGLRRLRGDGKRPPADLGSSFRPRLIPGEESRSIQFPEEEHGDKTAEERLSVLSLKIYSELR